MDRLLAWQFAEPRAGDKQIFETHGENPKQPAWNHQEYLRAVVDTINRGNKALVDGLEAR